VHHRTVSDSIKATAPLAFEMASQKFWRYYEFEAQRHEERATEATEAGFHDIALHLNKEAARFRAQMGLLSTAFGATILPDTTLENRT
jgi:hypothetical protein